MNEMLEKVLSEKSSREKEAVELEVPSSAAFSPWGDE